MYSQQSERLLAYLKSSPLLAGYSLSIYKSGQETAPDKGSLQLCGAQGIPHLCLEICSSSLNVAVENALKSRKSVFFRCPFGLFSFVIPVSADSCLACGGMRENLFDLYFHDSEQFAFLKGKRKVHPYEILEQLEKHPVTTEKEARETMFKAERLIASFMSTDKNQQADSTDGLQSAVTKVAEAIGRAESFESAASLFSETLGIMFDVPAIAFALKDEESGGYLMESCWGAFSGPSYLPSNVLPFHDQKFQPAILTGEELKTLFPKGVMTNAICLPLAADNELLGMAVLCDVSLTDRDLQLAKLLADKLVKKLQHSITDRETKRRERNVRMLEMIRTLALTESQEELLRLITEMAADLVEATNGSLMLLDREGKILRVASALGINPALAQNLFTKMGEGIAGRAAAVGYPLLIRDVEKELGPARQNRIRFVTKSCISLPLLFKGEIIGVLNLADKKNNTPFISADQEILSTFLDQATIILERSTILTKAKQSMVTDPLTGLYNFRFMKKRLNEELSRSIRYNLPLTLILADLDINIAGNDARTRTNINRRIKETAKVLNASLRDIDLIGRIGKKEFCIVLPSTTMKESLHVAERIKLTVANELNNNHQNPGNIAIRIGVASFPENGASCNDLIDAARSVLSRAEADGDNRICSTQTENATRSKNLSPSELR